MSEVKVNIFGPQGQQVGYFINPTVDAFPEGDYEIEGRFFDSEGQPTVKIEFNPEAVPYVADLSAVKGVKHSRLERVFVQRGRQPVKMSGAGARE
jgi:hypothetical protein